MPPHILKGAKYHRSSTTDGFTFPKRAHVPTIEAGPAIFQSCRINCCSEMTRLKSHCANNAQRGTPPERVGDRKTARPKLLFFMGPTLTILLSYCNCYLWWKPCSWLVLYPSSALEMGLVFFGMEEFMDISWVLP